MSTQLHIVRHQPVKPFNSHIGDTLTKMLKKWGLTEGQGCSCKALRVRMNAMTREQVLANIESLAQAMVQNLHADPTVSPDMPVWVKAILGGLKWPGMEPAAKRATMQLIKMACG
jgi:hypothetical protein